MKCEFYSRVIFIALYLKFLALELINCNNANNANKIFNDILSGKAPTTNKLSFISDVVPYNPKIRPGGIIGSNTNIDEVGALKIYVSILVRRLVGLDERNQMLSSFVMFLLRWNDPRLSWNSTMYDGIEVQTAPASSFWLPDLSILNMADASTNLISYVSNQNIIINSDGTIYLSMGIPKLVTRCNMNVYKYPFDRQTWY